MGAPRRLAGLLPTWLKIAWWGLVSPRLSEREPLVVFQAVILEGDRVLLTVRSDVQGWELPGGNAQPGEREEAALRREVREETGLEIEVEALVGDYLRSGFRPHRARVYRCRSRGGAPRPSAETPRVRWFPVGELPTTVLPWYRGPLSDALGGAAGPVVRREHQGLRTVAASAWIDLRMRATDLRSG